MTVTYGENNMLSYSMIQWLKRNGFRSHTYTDNMDTYYSKAYNDLFCLSIFSDGSVQIASYKNGRFVTYPIKRLPKRVTTVNDILLLDRYMRSGLLFGRTPYK